MLYIIRLFVIYISFYFVSSTLLVYQRGFSEYILAFSKEFVRLVLFIYSVYIYRDDMLSYISKFGKYRMMLGIMIVIGVVVTVVMKGRLVTDMIIGLKYGLLYIWICLSASRIGYHIDRSYMIGFISRLKRWFVLILIIGIVYQGAKMLYPERSMSYMGYGPIGDYTKGTNPPVYYLTGPSGQPRYSGIFSGPNNIGFLMALMGLWILVSRPYQIAGSKKKRLDNIYISRTIYIASVVMTLGRGVRLAIFSQIIMYISIYRQSIYSLLHSYRRSRMMMYIYYICGPILVAFIIYLIYRVSIHKTGSNVLHLTSIYDSLSQVSANIWGYGLGSAGPAIHYHGIVLPENYYIQLLIDFGIVGFGVFVMYWLIYARDVYRIYTQHITDPDHRYIRYIYILMTISICGLAVEGLFLHVREDTMVCYLSMIIYGMMRGHLARSR